MVNSDYDLELERAVKTIRKEKAKLVLLQFPDGLKNVATEVSEELEKKTGAKCAIWLGSCFGACDIPSAQMEKLKFDLIIQWGHSDWPFKDKKLKILK